MLSDAPQTSQVNYYSEEFVFKTKLVNIKTLLKQCGILGGKLDEKCL